MKKNKKEKDLENIAEMLEKEGLGDVVDLPKDYWKKEAEKFSDCVNKVLITRIEKIKQKGQKIEVGLCMIGKMPCERCKKMTYLCSVMPCIKFIKWFWGMK